MPKFVSEDDVSTFEGWLKYQAVDSEATSPEDIEMWRGIYEESHARALATPKVGLMKLKAIPGEYRYAVAVRKESGLWVTLWIQRLVFFFDDQIRFIDQF